MKKKFNLLLLGISLLFVGSFKANAAGSAYLKCEDQTIKVGASTNCTVYGNSDTDVTEFIASLETSEYLTISNATPNTGWIVGNRTSTTDPKKQTYHYTFDATKATLTPNKDFAVFSFTLTLAEAAKNLTQGECGQICLGSAFINGTTVTSNSSCYTPVVDFDKCEGEECNPETGAFVNYLILGSGALVALIAIVALNKNKKFYRV